LRRNEFAGDTGAFTGEISTEMLDSFGVKYTILGHSERRSMGESNNDINRKIKSALTSGVIPVLCVGENTRDQDHGYFNFVKNQLEECLAGVSKNLISKIIVAYEPVWAISTTIDRKDATANDSLEMSIFIKKVLSDKFGGEVSKTKILYGGSVSTKDAAEFLENGGVDGLLVGRASLDAKKFTEIIKICETLNK
jgi:triosephosphate isomerase